jgi:hypothetical protein
LALGRRGVTTRRKPEQEKENEKTSLCHHRTSNQKLTPSE